MAAEIVRRDLNRSTEVSKQRIAMINGIGGVVTLLLCFVIHGATTNPALRYIADVMGPIGAVTMFLAAIFFLVARDIDGPPLES